MQQPHKLSYSHKITITGQVQGVGFRPFVYNLAQQFGLAGTVSNNEHGVVIHLSGSKEKTHGFIAELMANPPSVARIDKHFVEEIEFQKFDGFQIIPSKKSVRLNLPLTPDLAICNACKEELADESNRRYHYPFITCVHCGPRWAITKTFPFERDHTAMGSFAMCDDCMNEYTDPTNRRFHSQTNSCGKCGIQLWLTDNEGEKVRLAHGNIFKELKRLLGEGLIIAVKNTSGYLLCCDAANEEAVQRLRAKKRRPQKPFAILYPDLDLLKKHITIDPEQESVLTSPERPIVIVQSKDFKGNLAISAIAPRLNQLGIMLPYSGILELLAKEMGAPIVATSGNLHGSPIISSVARANVALAAVADYWLHHELEIIHPQDDSVVKFSSKYAQKVVFRRSRGYAPNVHSSQPKTSKRLMALGAHLKSTVAFVPNDYLYVSEYLGNLDHFDVYERFGQVVSQFTELFEQSPEVILVDGHPQYQSTQFGKEMAKSLQAEIFLIQHHKAHFASVLGEHGLFKNEEPILGVIWDGTGYGDDQQIWGGEFFAYTKNDMHRVAHFDYFDWLAGDKMAKEPRLSLFSLADGELQNLLMEKFSTEELSIYQTLKERNNLKTSSVGRLFDTVASALGICDYNSYEGEAAILLENGVFDYDLRECTPYCELSPQGGIPTHQLLKNVCLDVKRGVGKEKIILNFLYTLGRLVFQVADWQKMTKIALSGGVFQNTVLIDMLLEMAGDSYELFFNRNLSPNDENISFGQIMYHLHLKNEL